MNAAKIILRTVAFLVGAAACLGVGVGIYREFHGGPPGVVPMFLLVLALMAGVPLLISWRRDFWRDPWVVPSALSAVCAFFYYESVPERLGLVEFAIGPNSSWLTFLASLLGYLVFISLMGAVAAFVYHGTHAFLLLLGRAISRNSRKA